MPVLPLAEVPFTQQASVGDWLARAAGPPVAFGEANAATYLGLIGMDYSEQEAA